MSELGLTESTRAAAEGRQTGARQPAATRGSSVVLTGTIVVLTAITAMVHLSLGGILFTLNGLGYAGLAVLIVIAHSASHPLIQRFDWFPRLALMGYAATTIVGYLIIGPYSTLGWLTKAVEVLLIGALVVDTLRAYGGVGGTWRKAIGSIAGR